MAADGKPLTLSLVDLKTRSTPPHLDGGIVHMSHVMFVLSYCSSGPHLYRTPHLVVLSTWQPAGARLVVYELERCQQRSDSR